MKKRLIILLICLVVSATMCLLASVEPKAPGPKPTNPNLTFPSRPTHTQAPVADLTIKLYVCDREDTALYEALAQQYTQTTGVGCQIVTGDLEALLNSDDVPTIFCLHSQETAQQWQDFLYDLTDSGLVEKLYSDSFALKSEGRPVALAMDVTGYGIVYNAALLARAGYTRSDMVDLMTFRQVVEELTALKKSNGFSAFSRPDFSNTDFAALMAGSSRKPEHIRTTLDLIAANGTAGNALEQFVAGKTVFYVGGAWEYETISQLGFNNLDLLPFYSDDGGSIPCVCSHYWAVNAYAHPEDIDISLEFLHWLVTAGEDGSTPVDALELFAPFDDATYGENVFLRLLLRKRIAVEPVTVSWSIAGGMTQKDLNMLSIALESYLSSPDDETWKAVTMLLP